MLLKKKKKKPMGQRKKITKEIRIYQTEWKWNHNVSKLWDAAKVALRRKHTVLSAYVRKEQRPHIRGPSLQVKELERQQWINPE